LEKAFFDKSLTMGSELPALNGSEAGFDLAKSFFTPRIDPISLSLNIGTSLSLELLGCSVGVSLSEEAPWREPFWIKEAALVDIVKKNKK
jgi:hypothetical protein